MKIATVINTDDQAKIIVENIRKQTKLGAKTTFENG